MGESSESGHRLPLGSQGAFVGLFTRELRYVLRSLKRFGVHDADVEDMAQEVFFRVHRRLDSFDSSRCARAWLLGFVQRTAADYRRLARHRREVFGRTPEPHSVLHWLEDAVLTAESNAQIMRALQRLSPHKRTVVRLHDLEGQTVPAIASALQLPVNTVYSRLRHGRKELQRAFERMAAQ